MDNRTDTSEDQQATPGHLPVRPKPAAGAGLTAGPHNDPPRSEGVQDTYLAPSNAGSQGASTWKSLQQAATRYPLRVVLSAATLGLTVVLLARRRFRAR